MKFMVKLEKKPLKITNNHYLRRHLISTRSEKLSSRSFFFYNINVEKLIKYCWHYRRPEKKKIEYHYRRSNKKKIDYIHRLVHVYNLGKMIGFDMQNRQTSMVCMIIQDDCLITFYPVSMK